MAIRIKYKYVIDFIKKSALQFDLLDRITSVDTIATYSYIGASRVKQRDYANGVSFVPTYDKDGCGCGGHGLRRMVGVLHQIGQSTLAYFTYTYNRTNNRLSEIRKHDKDGSNNDRGEKYLYDSIYRVKDFKEGSFDAQGNYIGNQTKNQDWQFCDCYFVLSAPILWF